MIQPFRHNPRIGIGDGFDQAFEPDSKQDPDWSPALERSLMRTHERLPQGSDATPTGALALAEGERPIKATGLGGSARPVGFGPDARWLGLMLDEVDYGMVLLDEQALVLHANHAARAECDAGHPLQLLGRELDARLPEHVALLHDALAGARRGHRKLLALGDARQPVSVAVCRSVLAATAAPRC
jgi:hypothetical protein